MAPWQIALIQQLDSKKIASFQYCNCLTVQLNMKNKINFPLITRDQHETFFFWSRKYIYFYFIFRKIYGNILRKLQYSNIYKICHSYDSLISRNQNFVNYMVLFQQLHIYTFIFFFSIQKRDKTNQTVNCLLYQQKKINFID